MELQTISFPSMHNPVATAWSGMKTRRLSLTRDLVALNSKAIIGTSIKSGK